MGLIGNILGAFGKKTATSVVQGLVNLDPDTASDVQVRQYGDMVEQRAQFVVNSQTRMNSVQEKLDSQNQRLDALKKGIANLLSKEQTDEIKQSINEGLTEAEQLKKDIASTEADLANAKANYAKASEDHKAAVKTWMQAKENLAKKKAENDALQADLDRAREAKKDAEKAHGLDTAIDTNSIITDSFDKKNKELQAEIEKNKITTDQLNEHTSNSILESAIKDAEKPTDDLSPQERLARL